MPVPVFIISLLRNPRCAGLRGRLSELGIAYERIDAVDARHLTCAELARLYDDRGARRRMGRSLVPAEIGCALSHCNVYRTIIERDIPLALVLEEDAILADGFHSLWAASDDLPADIDVLSLYSQYGFVRQRATAWMGNSALHESTVVLANTVGYFIRQSCARTLLEGNTPVSTVADWPVRRGAIRQFLTVPMAVSHSEAGSVIGPERPRWNVLGRYRAPAWLSGLLHLTFLAYLLQPHRYEGVNNYYQREVARRRRQIVAPGELDVSRLSAEQAAASSALNGRRLRQFATRARLSIVNRLRLAGYAIQDSVAGRARFPSRKGRGGSVSSTAGTASVKVGYYANWPDFVDAVSYLTPGSTGVWDGVAFVPAGSVATDWVGIFNQPAQRSICFNAYGNRVFFAIGEPPTPEHRALHVGQGTGSTVFTCDAMLAANNNGERRYVLTPPMLRTWSVRRTYDQLRQTRVWEKPRRLSWITSDVAKLPGHRRRLAFLERLRRELPFDLYGHGFKRVYDKWDGLAPYRYSIAFENLCAPLYFSEKLMDCFVCETMPIYVGDPQIARSFPPESFVAIDPDSPDVFEQIRSVVDSDLAQRNREAILEAKRRVLDEYNLFAMLSRWIRADTRPAGAPTDVRVTAVSLP